MAAYPGTLPDIQLMNGLQYAADDQSISTTMDVGPPKRRRRFSTRFGRHVIPIWLTGTELAAFDTWFDTTLVGGSATFTWTDTSDGSTVTFQFRTRPVWRPIKAHATATSRKWQGVYDLDRVA